MRYLLDTNAIIVLLNNPQSKLARRVRQEKPLDIALPAVVAHELFFGAFKSRRSDHNLAIVDAMQFAVVEFDKEDARKSGEIRASLARQGTPIGPYDVLIAGQALVRSLVLISHNLREFGRVPGLRVEDWEV
jgi:tRNA(fMet)-specific endonuclease VapC